MSKMFAAVLVANGDVRGRLADEGILRPALQESKETNEHAVGITSVAT